MPVVFRCGFIQIDSARTRQQICPRKSSQKTGYCVIALFLPAITLFSHDSHTLLKPHTTMGPPQIQTGLTLADTTGLYHLQEYLNQAQNASLCVLIKLGLAGSALWSARRLENSVNSAFFSVESDLIRFVNVRPLEMERWVVKDQSVRWQKQFHRHSVWFNRSVNIT